MELGGYKPQTEASQPSSIETGEARCAITPSAPGDNASETNMHTKNEKLDTGNQIWEHITLHTPPGNNMKHRRNEEEHPRSRQMELGDINLKRSSMKPRLANLLQSKLEPEEQDAQSRHPLQGTTLVR